MKKFSIEKLPADVREKIDFIEWNDYGDFDENLAGICWIKDEYELYDDGSHITGFENRKDLIDTIRCCVNKTAK